VSAIRSNVICDSGSRQVVIGGDFNFDFHVENIGKDLFLVNELSAIKGL